MALPGRYFRRLDKSRNHVFGAAFPIWVLSNWNLSHVIREPLIVEWLWIVIRCRNRIGQIWMKLSYLSNDLIIIVSIASWGARRFHIKLWWLVQSIKSLNGKTFSRNVCVESVVIYSDRRATTAVIVISPRTFTGQCIQCITAAFFVCIFAVFEFLSLALLVVT